MQWAKPSDNIPANSKYLSVRKNCRGKGLTRGQFYVTNLDSREHIDLFNRAEINSRPLLDVSQSV